MLSSDTLNIPNILNMKHPAKFTYSIHNYDVK